MLQHNIMQRTFCQEKNQGSYPSNFMAFLTGKCPVIPALEGGVKGHNIRGKYHTGEPRPLGR